MIYCCISASYKIFSISAEISAQDISEFAEKQFSTDVRITVVKLLEYKNNVNCAADGVVAYLLIFLDRLRNQIKLQNFLISSRWKTQTVAQRIHQDNLISKN